MSAKFHTRKQVPTQDFGENKNENHADEEPGLLGGAADTSITDDTDRKTSGHTGETDSETSAELDEAGVEGVVLLGEAVRDQDRNDETVDTNDTSHNDGDDVYIQSEDNLAESS